MVTILVRGTLCGAYGLYAVRKSIASSVGERLTQTSVDGDVELALRGKLHDPGLHRAVFRLELVKVGQHDPR